MALPILGAIAGGLFSAIGASSAAKAQSRAADKQIEVQKEMYDQTRTDLEPFRTAGVSALDQYSAELAQGPNAFQNFLGEFTADPGYQFRLSEAQKAIDAAQNARGGFFSGATLDAQQSRAQDMASQEYGNFYNRRANEYANWLNPMAGMVQMGQNAAAQQATAGSNYAAGVSNALANKGDAQAAGTIGFGNAINNGITNALGVWAYMNPPKTGGGITSSPIPQARPW